MGLGNISFEKDSLFLVTGGAGFIGSNLVESLLDLGYRVRCLDNLSTGHRRNIQPFLGHPDFAFIEGDVRDFEICLSACTDVTYVLHQAAYGSVPRSIEFPVLYEEINIKGTLHMMEAARQKGVRKFVYASSSSVYGSDATLPKKEGREGAPLSPYALTKKVDECYGQLYSDLYGLDTYGLRYFNVFGRRQDPMGAYAAVIPRFLGMLLRGDRPTIHGNGLQSRDFTYIENVVEANLKACLADHAHSGEAFNIAFGEATRLIDLYEAIRRELGKEIRPIFGPERRGDILHSLADIGKARDMLGYDPSWNFKDGILETIHWFVDHAGELG
jgi:UDP-N-acetylglucosamine/UDP-N-acetylgalactosamine 4-epimerase